MARKERSLLNRHGIPNLYIKRDKRSATGFACQFKDPRFNHPEFPQVTKQWHSLGSDIELAKARAYSLNDAIYKQLAAYDPVLDGIVTSSPKIHYKLKVEKWCDEYIAITEAKVKAGELKPKTLEQYTVNTNAIKRMLGKYFVEELDLCHGNKVLNEYLEQGKNTKAKQIRTTLIDLIDAAIIKGKIPSKHVNVMEKLEVPRITVKRSRLTESDYKVILQVAIDNNFANSYINGFKLALASGQRREDMVLARFKRGADWQELHRLHTKIRLKTISAEELALVERKYGGIQNVVPYSFVEGDYFHVFQQKTAQLIMLPLSLKNELLGETLGQVIAKCRTRVVSKFLLHHEKPNKCKIGDPINKASFSDAFKRARIASNLQWDGSPPTLHEIRSLSERTYHKQGIDTQVLLGHKDAATTRLYHDNRGFDWITLAI